MGVAFRNLAEFVRKGFWKSGSGSILGYEPKRLIVRKAKWYNDADSPVMLMIDDFTNAWVESNGRSTFDARGDWGGGHKGRNSILGFLENKFYSIFPEIRTTFFAIVGKISHYGLNQPFTFAKAINHDQASIDFFREVFADARFEIAYHGFNHGIPGKTTRDFVQEWIGFHSVEEGVRQIRRGQDIYQSVFKVIPSGGKYGGWEYNNFSDESVDLCGFRWWCRDWMPKDITDSICKDYYEPQTFGKNRVIALPSTVHGRHWSRQQIDRLISHRQIISIEEHMGALRPDGLIQTPNVYDDLARLKSLFGYLRGRNVWHAKGSEVADYFDAYTNTNLCDISRDSFTLVYSGIKKENCITLLIQPMNGIAVPHERITLICPDGFAVTAERSGMRNVLKFTLKTISGKHYLRYC